MSWPPEPQRARSGLQQPHDASGQRALAAARFPDDSEGLSFLERERDVVDGVHDADRAIDQHTLLDREVQLDVLHLDERLVAR